MTEQRRAGETPFAGHPVEEPFRKGFATSWRFAKAAEEVWPDGAPASAMDNGGRLDLAHG